MTEQATFIPDFTLNTDALDIKDDKSLAEAIEKEGRRGLEVGHYELKVTKARFHANKDTGSIQCAKDPTWFNVALTLESADGRTKDIFIQVPTKKVKYGEKGTLFVFKKFVEVMASLGEAVNLNNLGKVCAKYFASEAALAKLDGKTVKVDVGYEGPHAVKEGDTEQFKIMIKKGKEFEALTEDGQVTLLPDVASAKVYAQSRNLTLTFPEITKFHTAVKPAKAAKDWDK